MARQAPDGGRVPSRRAPHRHLGALTRSGKGQGYGSALVKHGLTVCDRDERLAYLECTKPRNIDFYQRYGFELLGTIQIGKAPPLFPMMRSARSR
jgi:GNAT superfamily N-acetyltransferase